MIKLGESQRQRRCGWKVTVQCSYGIALCKCVRNASLQIPRLSNKVASAREETSPFPLLVREPKNTHNNIGYYHCP